MRQPQIVVVGAGLVGGGAACSTRPKLGPLVRFSTAC
jgi:hypothetical protein